MADVDYETLEFKDQAKFRAWLDKHHTSAPGIWLKFYKKASGTAAVNYPEALDVALCYGWIDGQVKKGDDNFYLQKFTPRRAGSMWSKRNIENVTRLDEAGLMAPAGLAEVEQAKADGRWQAAYDKPSEMTVPSYFLAQLDKNPKAKQFFDSLNKANTYAIAWRLQTAKTEATRVRRMEKILAMLESGQKLH